MAFPLNPISGQTYAVNDRMWSYNGYAWNKFDLAPDPLTIDHLNVDYIDFNTAATGITQQAGRIYWDSNLNTTVLGMVGGINTALGQSLYKYVHNGSGGPINKGQVVYISGGHASTSLKIALANATSEMTAATTIGVAAENIANGADGFIITQGLLTGIDTNAYSPGDEGKLLWLAETNGEFTLTRPQAPSHGVVVGWLVKKAGSGAGSIFVKITNGQELEELHDVRITGVTNDNLLAYKGASGIWVNRSLSDLNIATTNRGNTFSVVQIMGAGITTAHLFVSGTATFVGPVGICGSFSFPDGTTQKTAYYPSNVGPRITDPDGDIIHNSDFTYIISTSNTANFGPTGSNMLLLSPFSFNTGCTLTRIATRNGGSASGNTGSIIFSVYDTNLNTGLPLNRLYASTQQNLSTTNFARYTATPNLKINAGSYWMGMLINIPSSKADVNYSFCIISQQSNAWEAWINGNRHVNNGTMNHLRYRFSGMTMGITMTHGFTSALTNGTHPAIGWGTSEMISSARCPWVGVSIQQ